MKNGYDQFFKNAKKVADNPTAFKLKQKRNQMSDNASSSINERSKVQTSSSVEELRQRLRQKHNKKNTKAIPWKLVGFSLLGFIITSLALWKADEIDHVVRNIEISLMGSANAETPAVENAKASPAAEAAEKSEAIVQKKEYTQEEINHFSRLNERKRELDSREEELQRTEQELLNQKIELEKKMAELEQTRRNISSVLDEKVQVDDKKIDNLVQVYSNMKPIQAAKAFEEMDEALAIEIIGRMKKKNAAEILNLVKSEKVKVLSEKYTGYKRY